MDNPSSPHCMNWGECALGVRRGGGGTIDCQRQEPENASHWIRVVFFPLYSFQFMCVQIIRIDDFHNEHFDIRL